MFVINSVKIFRLFSLLILFYFALFFMSPPCSNASVEIAVLYSSLEKETQEERFKKIDYIIDKGGAYGGKKMLFDKDGKIANNTYEGIEVAEGQKRRKLNDTISMVCASILFFSFLSFVVYQKRSLLTTIFDRIKNISTPSFCGKNLRKNRLPNRISKRVTRLKRN